MSVGCLMMTIDGGIGEIWKFYIDRVMAEMIILVITRLVVKEIRGSKAGMDLIGMIEDLMIEDTSLRIEFKVKILVQGTAEIGVRVKILVEILIKKHSQGKVDEGNLRVDVSETKLNVVANVSNKNPVENFCEVWLLPESVARVAAIVGDHRGYTPRH
ncbi:hypothetical protein TNCV_5126451 [Trichonephila clavipes]|nr:hypothetical protein TNCV_5126451 [Trichonephila clavipes]